MNLSEAYKGKELSILNIAVELNQDLGIRLMHLGFLPNEKISIVNQTPISHDAILVNIKGSQIALTKSEAKLIQVKEI